MRIVGEIPHPQCKITLFHWNNRYLIKLETSQLEQTFKVPEYELSSEQDLKKIVDATFIETVLKRFSEMDAQWAKALAEV
ncbi:MAG: hypothetical protein MUC38_03490 [Cyclobacteriaceae bacterium]|jgi:hypothetical protein|nr:hypothetical protein [Cyclobacteriaceae bacterium]